MLQSDLSARFSPPDSPFLVPPLLNLHTCPLPQNLILIGFAFYLIARLLSRLLAAREGGERER